jgi:hypothetical protein
MEKPRPTTPERKASKPWERLEDLVRDHVQHFSQALLEEEVTELVGPTKSAWREAVDVPAGYRNDWGKPRRLTLTSGTIMVLDEGVGLHEHGRTGRASEPTD